MQRSLARLYVLLDSGAIRGAGLDLMYAATILREAGVGLLQYRDKHATPAELLANARRIAAIFAGSDTTLILNDFPEIAADAGWDGVHVGQKDESVEAARQVLGPRRIVGVSTHKPDQVRRASLTDADYIAYGPIFATKTKADAEPAVGLAGLGAVRLLTTRPLVAIGGISRDLVTAVLQAGADSVAVIGALTDGPEGLASNVASLLQIANTRQ